MPLGRSAAFSDDNHHRIIRCPSPAHSTKPDIVSHAQWLSAVHARVTVLAINNNVEARTVAVPLPRTNPWAFVHPTSVPPDPLLPRPLRPNSNHHSPSRGSATSPSTSVSKWRGFVCLRRDISAADRSLTTI